MEPRHKIPISILVCDDEAGRKLTKAVLEQAHVSNALQFVEDEEQLLDYLYQRGAYAGERGLAPRPGLILLDLDMPRPNAREALRVIKQDETLRDIPVVVLSTSRSDEDIVRRAHLGVESFITKPFTFSGLVDAMDVVGRYWLEIVELPPVVA